MPETKEKTVINDVTTEDGKTVATASSCETKLQNEPSDCAPTDTLPPTYDLNNFQLKRILNNNSVRKSIALLGTFPDISTTDEAIILFEKKAFQNSEVSTPLAAIEETPTELVPAAKATYFDNKLKVQTEFINNIYGSYQCIPSADLSGIKATVVYPATEKHIEKYSICQKYIITETPKCYEDITLPYLQSSQFSLEWVYNILEHKQESERIVFEDNDPEIGFILLPDLKWDGRNVETLYLLAIPHKHNIKSLRDLTAADLTLLQNIRKRAGEAIEERYGLSQTQLRMYFHYQPSFYHLHVHINPVRNDAPGIWCEKSHMLDTVINNLELMSDYYQRATLPFVLYDGNKLLDLYEKEFVVKRKQLKRSIDSTNNGDKVHDDRDDNVAAKKIKATAAE